MENATRQASAGQIHPGLIGCCILLLSATSAAGTTFGIYDARTLAMGGTSVASANNDNGQFYNAALLAFNDEIEERTQDSRFLFPIIIPQLGKAAIDLEEFSNDNPDDVLTRAIGDFNAAPDAQTAQSVVSAASNLDGSLAGLAGEELFADIYFGLAGSEPGKFRGAGFFLGTRLLAGGQSSVTPADRTLLANYQEGLLFVASNGTQGVAHPELFDANGALIDPDSNFDSTVSAAGAAITEAGVAMSRQFQLFGKPIAAGLSFKVQRVDTFEDVERLVDNRIDTEQNNEDDGNINFDIGLVKAYGENWRVGLAVKDIIPHNYETSLGTEIRLRPRARIGTAYQAGRLQIAADVDITSSEPFAGESETQEAAVGAEWAVAQRFNLRAGFRQDVRGDRGSVASLGIGLLWKRFVFDAAIADGENNRSAALQFGIAF